MRGAAGRRKKRPYRGAKSFHSMSAQKTVSVFPEGKLVAVSSGNNVVKAVVSRENNVVKAVVSREDNVEKAIMRGFNASMRRYKSIRDRLNAPIGKYDVKTCRAFLEYPDGRKVFLDDEA